MTLPALAAKHHAAAPYCGAVAPGHSPLSTDSYSAANPLHAAAAVK